MKYARLLPNIKKDQKFSEWSEEWLSQTAPLIQATVNPEDMTAVRDRNEKLAAVLPTLITITACLRDYITKEERKFEASNPRPIEKGITAWNSAKKAHLADFENFLDFVNGLHQAVSTRLSVSQSGLRSKSDEVKHGLQ